jgi:DNA replication and repair protein RecF
MELRSLTIQHFRNLSEVEMNLERGMNVIYGENGQGKTNLLEAVFVLSTLKSFRTRHLPETLQFGTAEAVVQGGVRSTFGNHSLLVSVREKERIAMLDRKKVEALHYLGAFNVFLFSYPMLEVIRGGPDERRRFLDRSIAMSKPSYLPELMNYHRALKQKNALLFLLQRREVNRKEAIEEVHSFNQQLLEHGLTVAADRAEYINLLQELLSGKQKLFFRQDWSLGIELKSSFISPKEEVQSHQIKILDREIARGHALLGVHRDELLLTINGKELRRFGSSGQHRAFLLLMMLAQLELYEAWREDRPVLLLDDFDSELDEGKIRKFLDEIGNRYQTLISSSRKDLFSGVRMFEIEAGRLLERN